MSRHPVPGQRSELPWYSRQIELLLLNGYSVPKISKIIGISPASIYNFLATSHEGQKIREKLARFNSTRFELLYSEIISKLQETLHSENETSRMDAIKTWLKYNSKLIPQSPSAEDVVIQILNQNIQQANES